LVGREGRKAVGGFGCEGDILVGVVGVRCSAAPVQGDLAAAAVGLNSIHSQTVKEKTRWTCLPSLIVIEAIAPCPGGISWQRPCM